MYANQFMDTNQAVSVGVIWPLVHHHDSNWHMLLFFNPQQAHNDRIFQEVRKGRQLFNLLCIHGDDTKSPSVPIWVLEVPSPEVVYAKDTQGLWVSNSRVLLPLDPAKLTSASSTDNCWEYPCDSRNPDGFCSLIP